MNFVKSFFKVFLLFILLSCSNESKKTNKSIVGKVIAVKDGDTIDILFDGKPLTIRFAHIDCPEKKQPFGNMAKKFTSDRCFGQTVTNLNDYKFDRNKRLIGVIINEQGENLNKALVKAGLAWHYLKYSTDETYSNLESLARQEKVGMWSDPNINEPWNWRKRKMERTETL